MTNKMRNSKLCTPGQRLCAADSNHLASDGTYTLNGYIYSSIAGTPYSVKRDGLSVIEVRSSSINARVPEVGSVVTARVTFMHSEYLKVDILAVGAGPLKTTFNGTLRKINVRENLVDKVEMYDCFRPDDIILAQVLSQGDAMSYEVSTAAPELGVVTAKCEDGHSMVPVSWTAMKCHCRTEKRKVAKVVPQNKVT